MPATAAEEAAEVAAGAVVCWPLGAPCALEEPTLAAASSAEIAEDAAEVAAGALVGAVAGAVDAPAAADAAGVAATGAAGALEATGAADADAAAEGACVEAPAELEAPEAEEEPADGASAVEEPALLLVAGVVGAVGVPGMVNSQPGWMRSASWMVVPSGWVVLEAAPAM